MSEVEFLAPEFKKFFKLQQGGYGLICTGVLCCELVGLYKAKFEDLKLSFNVCYKFFSKPIGVTL